MKVNKITVLCCCIVIELVGLVIFLKGFFPIRTPVQGYANTKDHDQEPSEMGHPAFFKAPFDRLVFILIDALRADFVFPYGDTNLPRMKYVSQKMSEGSARTYMAKAHSPTVTMPRIKALVSGGIPGFVDVALNFDSSAFIEDNLITQLHRQGRHIVFYGDDTWMRLFPDHFIRTDGTTSFFVTDYTEVDHNVTRHLDDELSASDWDVLLLHYLGLDHIGHLVGPRSPLVPEKLEEMDQVVQHIYDALREKDKAEGHSTLLLLCGDHGMSEQGSHGGSTPSETATPLVLMGQRWETAHRLNVAIQEVQQVDVAPTLSTLLGLPIPKNSLGILITDVLQGLDARHRLSAAYVNAQQIVTVLKQNVADYEKEPGYRQYQRAVEAHKSWLSDHISTNLDHTGPGDPEVLGSKVSGLYVEAMRSMTDRLASSLAMYDLHAMGMGILLLWMVLIILLYMNTTSSSHLNFPLTHTTMLTLCITTCLCLMFHCVVCTGPHASPVLCDTHLWAMLAVAVLVSFVGVVITFGVVMVSQRSFMIQITTKSYFERFLIATTILHTSSLLSSSFVEEEHQTWYFFSVTLGLLFVLDLGVKVMMLKSVKVKDGCTRKGHRNKVTGSNWQENNEDLMMESNNGFRDKASHWRRIFAMVVLLVLCRIAREWNRTGDKWAHLPDVGDWLVRPENINTLSMLNITSLLITACMLCTRHIPWLYRTVVCVGLGAVYCFRAANNTVILPGFGGHGPNKGLTEARIAYTCVSVIIIHSLWTLYKNHKTFTQIQLKKKLDHELNITTNERCRSIFQMNTESQNDQMCIDQNIYVPFWNGLHTAWIIMMFLLLRPHNMALVAMVTLQQQCVSYVMKDMWTSFSTSTRVLVYMAMAHATYFYQGNSNSLSSIDVSAGYIGLEDYQPVLIGLLMALSTYVGPIFWLISLLLDTARHHNVYNYRWALQDTTLTLFLCRALPVAVYTVLVTSQRYHLFVWTVFSPKLLYEAMYTLVIGLVCMAVLGYQAIL